MKPLRLSDDMFWRVDPEVDAMRKLPSWVEFHREAGKRSLYFERPVKQGRGCACVAFTVKRNSNGGWNSYHLADGSGRTPVEAMEDAYRKSGRADAELDSIWEKVAGRTVEVDEFEALFG